jgi:hypothetical protein
MGRLWRWRSGHLSTSWRIAERQSVALIDRAHEGQESGAGQPHADLRAYFVRLDKICGVENWSHTITLSDRGVVCALTIFSVTKSATGDYPRDAGDENPATSAESHMYAALPAPEA